MTTGNEVGKVAFKLELTGKEQVMQEAQQTGVSIGSSLAKGVKSAGGIVAKGLGAFLKTSLATAKAAIATSGAVVGALTGAAISGYKDLEQSIGGAQKVFGDAWEQVLEDGKNAAQEAQISTNEYLDQATKFGMSMVRAYEGDVNKAAEATKMAITDMADNANTFGTDLESIQHAYQGMSRGVFGMLDNLRLGYSGTADGAKQLLMDAAKIRGEVGYTDEDAERDRMNFGKVVEAIHLVQEQQKIAGTAAKESMETIAGSANYLKAAWENFTTSLADPNGDIGATAEGLVHAFDAFTSNAIPAFMRTFQSILPAIKELGRNIIKTLAKAIAPVLPELIKTILDLAVELLDQATEFLPELADGIMQMLTLLMNYIPIFVPPVFNFVFALFEQIAQKIPEIIYILTEAIMRIVDILLEPENMTRLITGSLQFLKGMIEAIPLFIAALANHLPTIIESIVEFLTDPEVMMEITIAFLECLKALVEAVPLIIDSLGSAFVKLFEDLWDFVKGKGEEFADKFGDTIAKGLLNAIGAVLSIVEGTINWCIGAAEKFINFAVHGINVLIRSANVVGGAIGLDPIGEISDVKFNRVSLPKWQFELAEGGLVTSATTALIGEDGKEAVIPLERNQDNWAGLLASKLAEEFEEHQQTASPINVYLNATINNDMDAEELCNKLTTALRRAA